MLRKDVKLGFAIGGIMLAVLVVYVLVVPGADRHPAQLVTDESQAKTTDKPADSTPTDVKPVDLKPADVRGSDAAKPGDLKVDAKPTDRNVDPLVGPVTDKPIDTAKADAPAGDNSSEKNASEKNAGDKTAKANDAGLWEAALNDGKLPPTMMSTTPPVQNKAKNIVPQTDKTADKTADKLADKTGGGSSKLVPPIDNTPADKPVSDKAVVQNPVDPAGTNDKPAEPSPTDRTHVIQANETLTSIAAAVYNDGRQWKRLAQANPKVNPNRLKVGSKLVIPPAASSTASASASTDSAIPASATTVGRAEAAVDPQTQYRVESNDNLYRISMKLYGRADRVEKLYELNKTAIGPDKGRLKLHMVLKLPEAPTSTLSASAAR